MEVKLSDDALRALVEAAGCWLCEEPSINPEHGIFYAGVFRREYKRGETRSNALGYCFSDDADYARRTAIEMWLKGEEHHG